MFAKNKTKKNQALTFLVNNAGTFPKELSDYVAIAICFGGDLD